MSVLARAGRCDFTIPCLLLGLLAAPGAARGQAPRESAPAERRSAIGQCVSPAGTLLYREQGGQTWRVCGPQEAVATADVLLALPGEKAAVVVRDGAARLTLWGNLPEFSSFPVLESAVVLHASPDADLDFTLERGRVIVSSPKGKARARLRFQGRTWDLTLEERGAEVALELYGRWAAGAPFRPKPTAEDVPTAALVVFVLKGQAALRVAGAQYAMSAPPGPSYFHWNSVSGPDRGTARRDKLPSWAEQGPRPAPEAKALRAAVEAQRRELAAKPVAGALADGLKQADAARREVAVFGLAAVDDLARLAAGLAREKEGDVRDATVVALQHWIGRGPGQDGKLYQFLTRQRQYTPSQAETVLQLLHGFSTDDLDRPETYETLIAYLRHPLPAVRQLARWYLYRAAPAGRAIAYDPTGPEAERERAVKEWKKLIPDGKLPAKAQTPPR